MEPKHTPAPWKVAFGQFRIKDESGNLIARTDQEITKDREGSNYDNAAFIVRAVNCHDELLAALRFMVQADASKNVADKIVALNIARQALAKAEGK